VQCLLGVRPVLQTNSIPFRPESPWNNQEAAIHILLDTELPFASVASTSPL